MHCWWKSNGTKKTPESSSIGKNHLLFLFWISPSKLVFDQRLSAYKAFLRHPLRPIIDRQNHRDSRAGICSLSAGLQCWGEPDVPHLFAQKKRINR